MQVKNVKKLSSNITEFPVEIVYSVTVENADI